MVFLVVSEKLGYFVVEGLVGVFEVLYVLSGISLSNWNKLDHFLGFFSRGWFLTEKHLFSRLNFPLKTLLNNFY